MNNIALENKVRETAHALVFKKGYVCAVDVLLRLQYLTKERYDSWRSGRIGYLDRAWNVNLSKLSLINKTIMKLARELKLERSWRNITNPGEGQKQD